MTKPTPITIRIAVAVGVYVTVLVLTQFVTYLAYERLYAGTSGIYHVAALLFLWAIMAYFPARQAYMALSLRMVRAGRCIQCGYDLRGNESGVCPECGVPTSAAGAAWRAAEIERGAEPRFIPKAHRRRRLAVVIALITAGGGMLACLLLGIRAKNISDRYGDFEPIDSPVEFVRWRRGMELAETNPNDVFGVIGGKVRFCLTMDPKGPQPIESVGVFDSRGWSWVDADLVNRHVTIDQYSPQAQGASPYPQFSFIDTDGDGMPDRQKRWKDGKRLCADAPVEWVDCSAAKDAATTQP